MIEVEIIKRKALLLRFLTKGNEKMESPPFIATGIIEFDMEPHVAWGKGFMGSLTYPHLRELLQILVDHNIKVLKANRMDKHTLPYSKIDEEGNYVVDIVRLANRFNIVKRHIP